MTHRRSRARYAVAECAPGLQHLAPEGVPMPPGPSGQAGSLCVAVQPQVAVLGAKTRPKKIVLVASDGAEHPFLLKVLD